MKKIFGFGKKKKGQSPACRASLPGVGYELREKELGKLHRAAAGGDLGKLQQLLKKHDINQLDKENRTPLHLACANGHLDVVTYLVDNKCKLNLCDNNNRSPLMKAVQCQQEKCATMLLEHGAEPNLVDVNSNTALHLAAQTANISLVVQLLEYNAHIDSQNKEGYTPLTIAITENHQEMVEFLLKKGADVHARDKSKRTPLMIAASGGELSLIKVLLQYGADVSHKDINGWTSEDHARIGGYSSLSKQLSEYANWKNVEKPSPNNTKGMSVFSSPDRVGDVGFALGAPATDKEEMQQSPNQTSRTRDSGKVIDDLSQGDSVRSSEKDEGDDSWLTSEEEELDFTPKKPQKPSLTLLMNSSHQFKKNNGEDIRIGSPQSSRQNLKQVTRNHTNVDKKERKELTNEDISEASKQEKEELEEEEEDEEEFSQEEKEDEDTEDEEGSQDDYTEDEEEEYVGKLEHEHDQELEIFNNAVKSEREVKRGSKNIHDGGSHETCEEKDQEMQESVDIPVSFIAGHYEGLKENITAISSKMVNNEVPYDSSKKEDGSEHEEIHEFQNTNELLHTDGNEKIRCKTRCSFEDSEMTAWKKDASPSVLNSCYIKEENSNLVDDIFESDDDPWSEAENRRYENRRQDSENLRFLVDQNAGKEQCKNSEGLANTICETLEPESENLPVNSGEENLKAFQPSIKEESSEEEDDIEQPQISNVVDKSLICSGNREAQNPSEDTAIRKDTMSVLGLDEEEDTESPWDSECASESPRKLPVNLLISSAIRTDTHMQSIFEEPNEGFCEKTLDSQPKTTQAILETHDTSSCPAKGIEIGKRQKSDLMEELGLDDADDIEDASDWDSTSISLKNLPGTKSPKVLTFGNPSSSLSTLTAKDDAAATASGVIPSRLEEMSKAQTVTAPENTHLYSLQKQLLPVILKSKDELSEPSFNMPSPDEEREDAGENCKKQVEEEKRKQKCGEMLAMEKREDTYKSYMQTLAGNGINQQMKQKLAIKGNQYSTVESGETTEEEKHMKNSIPSKERAKLIQIPLKGSNSALNVKDVKKNENKKRISKQRGNQQMNSTNGNQFQVLDDSTLSETSQDEGRPGAKTVDERNKIGKQMDVADDFDELTQSSDTATEDLELPTSTYRDAMLLIEQLCMDGKADSISLLKIQNLLHGYERLIDHEKGRYTQLLGKVRKLENEKKELQTVLEETRELKSMLDHQKMEWESDVSSLKFTLKQEEEKRMSAEMLYEKNRELLRKKEDQYCKEMEEKQQLELTQRSLEMELRTLRNHLKQVEEERNEIQRQLSQEQSARALQEGILNNHLWKQKEIEEETKITVAKSSEVPDNQREKDLLHKNQILQDEIAILRLELDQIRIRHQEEETKYLEENEVLREKNEDLRKELKLNEEALTQTVFQYNGQLNVLKTESAMLTSKIEHAKENKDRLETEMESFRSRLNSAVQELECCRKSKSDVERTLQREHDEWLRLQDKLNHDLSNLRDSNTILSQQLSKVETKANSLENELHHVTHTLREKTLLLESTQRDLSHAQCQAKELDHARQIEKDQMSKYIVKQESMQERLAQLQSENILLRQQLEDMQNKGIIKEKVVSDVQDRFSDIFSKLRADTEKQVHMMEERNKELITKCNNLREQVFKYDTEKVEREGTVRQLQQELADALKKQSMSEASLEVTTRYRNDLEDDKLHLQKEIDKIKTKLQESEDQYIQSERRVHDLKNALDSKEREVNASSQKLQDLLIASSGTNNAIKQLEEHIQRLEIENARLEATTKQQTSRIEVLQKDLRDSASVHNRLEDLITGLQTAKINLEEQLNQQVQKQTMLSMTAKDTHNLWEEELKSRSKLGVRLSQLDREKAEMLEQFESERKKVKKLVELKRSVDVRLDQEMKRNSELQKECNGMKKLLKTAKKKLKEYETGECVSQFSFQGELKNRYSEMDNEVSRLRTKTDELSKKLDIESKKSTQLESTNRDLREQLSSMKILHKNHEKLEKSKWQLEGEVANLKHQVETNMMDHSQIEQYKREIEERARQEIRQKLEEVNLFLQTQAASQETLEQIRTTNNASLRNQLEHRIRDLESELARIKNTQEDSVFQKQSTQTELERYKDLYLEELKIRKSLASKLDRANERIAEANAKLLHERHRSKSLIANSIVNGSLAASPVLDTTQLGNLGNNLTLNRSLGLGGSFINPTGNALSSKNRVEAYLAKMQQELEKSITKELDQATAELETGSVRVSPVGSTDGSSKNLNVDQDPVSRATQQYLDVLKKNYMI
ncbi:ankyrin repeat domain-containing protein 26-like isoform X10 [Trachemys scripta elegans]|uniref:ankyrin repeat domain-containing protein 26-like isoform X10 n=1 Tax=Trachemys scripta elegans TaxID=31138 RepID=UPI0015546834|nr:ankyrin repeat domain-containing protein 26-like isoform X10 [Trachemys scripta elegans]